MRDITKKKKTAMISAAVIIGILGCYIAVLLYPVLFDNLEAAAVVGIFIVYAVLVLAVIIGVLVALGQRLKELDGGEEEEAKKY